MDVFSLVWLIQDLCSTKQSKNVFILRLFSAQCWGDRPLPLFCSRKNRTTFFCAYFSSKDANVLVRGGGGVAVDCHTLESGLRIECRLDNHLRLALQLRTRRNTRQERWHPTTLSVLFRLKPHEKPRARP